MEIKVLVSVAVCSLAFASGASGFGEMEKALRSAKVPDLTFDAMKTHPARGNTPASLEVLYTLRPTADSSIRCQLTLPDPARWEGRLFGLGNSGFAGWLLPFGWEQETLMRRHGGAVATTDMGTARWTAGGKHNGGSMPEEARRDFAWRSTHLLTTSAKALIAAAYGKGPSRCYWLGGSTGGCQGFSEAQRFPEDWDGFLLSLPACGRVQIEAMYFHVWKQTHSSSGEALFTKEQLKLVADCALAYMADKDEPYARGKFLTDTRLKPEQAKDVLDLAAKRDPKLADPELRKRLEAIFAPVIARNRFVHEGLPFGADISQSIGSADAFLFSSWKGRLFDPAKSNWGTFNDWTAAERAEQNALNPDLLPLARRGGKIMMTVGLADATVKWTTLADYYEDVCAHMGGLEKTREFFRAYFMPGVGHGGDPVTYVKDPYWDRLVAQLIDWTEKGKDPGRVKTQGKGGETFEVASYPAKAVLEDGKWVEKPFPRAAVRIDAFYR